MSSIVRKTDDFILINPETINTKIDPESQVVNKYYEPNKAYWLYALKLKHGRYYVGFTGKVNPYNRIMEHVEGEGAKWTQLHKPIEVLEVRDAGSITLTQVKALERNLTWAYMNLYGVNKVRGGIFNYTGRIIRVGKNTVMMGYLFQDLLVGLTAIFAITYILLRHYLNWW